MTWSILASAVAGSASGGAITTPAIDTSGASLLLCAIIDWTSPAASILTDSKANSNWFPLTVRTQSSMRLHAYINANPSSVGSGHTFTATPASGSAYASIIALALAGGTTPGVDLETGAVGSSGTSIQPGSQTPSINDDILVALVGSDGVAWTGLAIDSGFTIQQQIAWANAAHMGLALATKIQTTAGAENPTWSWTGSTQRITSLVSLKLTETTLARVTQSALEAVELPSSGLARVSQTALEVLPINAAAARVSQAAIEVVIVSGVDGVLATGGSQTFII